MHGGTTIDTPAMDGETDRGGGFVRIASVAALGGFLFGYDSAVINGANSAIQSTFGAGPLELGFTVAAALLGAAGGAFLAGRLADRIGRLSVMKLAAVLFFVSAVGSAFTPNLDLLIFFRLVGGVGVGVASVIAPAYIAEIAPARIRGRLGSLQQLAIVTGIFISLLVDFLFAKAAGSSTAPLWFGVDAWRWMFLAMVVPAVVYGALMLTIPESPRYLIARGRVAQAREILTGLLGARGVDGTVERIQASMAGERKPSWRDLLVPGTGRIAPIVWVGLLLSIFQQFVGINVIFYYSNILWEAVGFSENQSFVITAVINIATTIVAIALIDRIGRKPLLVIGSIGMTVSLALMALIFGTAPSVAGTPDLHSALLGGASPIVALVAANLFVIAFGMSWGPVVWVLLGEMFPNRMRAAGLALAAGGQWVANWIITVTFPGLKDLSLGLAYGMYATFALLSLIFVIRWVKETKGKQLEDMHA